MAVWLNLVFDTAPVLGKLLPSLMVLVSFLDPPLCRGVLVAAMLLESLLAPTHGTVYSPTTLFVVMIIELYGLLGRFAYPRLTISSLEFLQSTRCV